MTSRLRDLETARHQDFETSRLRDFKTSRLQDFKTSRHRDFYSKLYTVNLKKRSTKTFVLSPYLLSPYLLKTIHAFTTHITLGAMPVRVGKSRRAKKSKSRKVKESKSFVNYDLWSQCLLTRKHCPKQQGRYPGFHAPSDTFSDLVSVQWYTAGGVSLVIYSCATAHDLHVIPS